MGARASGKAYEDMTAPLDRVCVIMGRGGVQFLRWAGVLADKTIGAPPPPPHEPFIESLYLSTYRVKCFAELSH